MLNPRPHPAGPSDGLFVTTLWTTVLQAGSAETTQSRPALERLCRAYWYPIYAHVRRRGHSPHDAQDLTQGFFARLIAQCAWQDLSPAKGRFRSFLLAVLANFLADERDRRDALKRGGGQIVLSLDETAAEERYALEAGGGATPEQEFDRRWALAVLERAIEALALEQTSAGRQHQFGQLRGFLLDATGTRDYTAVATELKMPPNTVAVNVRRLRQRYRELVRAEVAQTLAHPEDVDAELSHLLAAVRG
jgi:RNA polymerase sigma-70 factor (ECF subfamily)